MSAHSAQDGLLAVWAPAWHQVEGVDYQKSLLLSLRFYLKKQRASPLGRTSPACLTLLEDKWIRLSGKPVSKLQSQLTRYQEGPRREARELTGYCWMGCHIKSIHRFRSPECPSGNAANFLGTLSGVSLFIDALPRNNRRWKPQLLAGSCGSSQNSSTKHIREQMRTS